jgi:hypothetical protein
VRGAWRLEIVSDAEMANCRVRRLSSCLQLCASSNLSDFPLSILHGIGSLACKLIAVRQNDHM